MRPASSLEQLAGASWWEAAIDNLIRELPQHSVVEDSGVGLPAVEEVSDEEAANDALNLPAVNLAPPTSAAEVN